MPKEFAKKFYSSKRWQNTREAYAKSIGYLCEECLKHGVYKAGEIVHHRIHLTPENIHDSHITLGSDNLELLCRDCHAAKHKAGKHRYTFDSDGMIRKRGLKNGDD